MELECITNPACRSITQEVEEKQMIMHQRIEEGVEEGSHASSAENNKEGPVKPPDDPIKHERVASFGRRSTVTDNDIELPLKDASACM